MREAPAVHRSDPFANVLPGQLDVDPHHGQHLVHHGCLMAADLFSGWGVRTLSSEHPSYNPLAYHLGAVWPAENATIALGFKRYGFEAQAERLISAMFAAADRFHHRRLPEALGGHSREQAPVPTVYPAS